MENDLEYESYTPGDNLRIYKQPPLLHKSDVGGKGNIVRHADDEKLVIDLTVFNPIEFFIGLIGSALLTYTFFATNDSLFNQIFCGIIINVFFMWLTLGAAGVWRKRVVFNRIRGTVIVPAFGGMFRTKTIIFSEAKFGVDLMGPLGREGGRHLFISNGLFTRVLLEWNHPVEMLSFYVWYMDKNRPLPPGTAFDLYRSRDNMRRKHNKQVPLYPANIRISN